MPISEWKDQHDAAVPMPGIVWDNLPYPPRVVFHANAAKDSCDIPATTWFRRDGLGKAEIVRSLVHVS